MMSISIKHLSHSTIHAAALRRCLHLAIITAIFTASAGTLAALPRFALLTGTRCSGCHFNPQGGGIRTELGWSSMNEVGLIKPSSIGLDSLLPTETNTLWDGLVTFGLDTRFQIAKLGRPPAAERKFIPMQLAPAVAIAPLDWLTIFGAYNFGADGYPGMTSFDATVMIQPDITLPALRVGYMQPSIGIRQDDHTMFTRRDAAGLGSPIIPPNYNEIGAEINYEGLRWLTVNGGVYLPRNIAEETQYFIDSTKPAFLGRVVLWPQLLDEGINTMAGGSFYGNQNFQMVNGFAGIGLADKATVYGEGSYFKDSDGKIIRNLVVQSTLQLAQWINLEWRYEWGLSEHPSTGPFYAHSFVMGSEFFPFPYIELRPEYRYMEASDYTLGQYTLQIHAFF